MSTPNVPAIFNKTRPLQLLMGAQFLTAFADNMILFITLAIIKQKLLPEFYVNVVQGAFLIAFIVLAPFVGAFADRNAKSNVLLIGNLVKAVGILCLIVGLDPAISYAIVGIGAAVYSPAKYGILTELTSNEHSLLKANAQIEGYTILAILTGSLAGGLLAQHAPQSAMFVCLGLYGFSLLAALWIPRGPRNLSIRYGAEMILFFRDTWLLLRRPSTRFNLIGTGSFWMSSSVFRLALIAWIPLHLGISDLDKISMLQAATGIGIMIGALLTPKLVPSNKYPRAFHYGAAMALCIAMFTVTHSVVMTVVLLLVVGFAGGVFIVPMNAALQHEAHTLVGAGKTIAIQNFIEYAMMAVAVGGYYSMSQSGVSVDQSILLICAVLFILIAYLWIRVNMTSRRASRHK